MTTRICRTGHSCWVHERVEEAGILIDGKSYYSMFYEAALRAETSILLSGWQFDSKVALLRGEEAERAQGPVTLLAFLDDLCKKKPDLRIYILAWDYSVVFALEREWLQKMAFDWMTHRNLNFTFDASVPLEGSHHQKFAVIDQTIAFVGGTDLCEHRWDERSHLLGNPLRFTAEGEIYTPYHEVQAFVRGPVVARLVEFFSQRWVVAAQAPLELAPRTGHLATPRHDGIAIPAQEVALCRTSAVGGDPPDGAPRCHDIREMYSRAANAAERMIYIETQYFTARSFVDALTARMREEGRTKLDVILVLPIEPEAPKEELAMGIHQARAIKHIAQVAAQTGHRVGIYTTAQPGEDGSDVGTYIHSKLIVVDDRFLSVGSANLSNRSMGVDTELNLAFETDDDNSPLTEAIRSLRITLLDEHIGAGAIAASELADTRGLVERLDAIASAKSHRLRAYRPTDPSDDAPMLSALHASAGRYLDPEKPELEADLESPQRWFRFFARGIEALRARMGNA